MNHPNQTESKITVIHIHPQDNTNCRTDYKEASIRERLNKFLDEVQIEDTPHN